MDFSKRILVVEDETGISGFIGAILSANGFEVEKALNGKEALMMISSCCPDAVILDLGLPDMDGQRVIQSVRTWTAVPILVVSARSHERDKVMAFDFGADDYITKPFSSGELIARVKAALRHANINQLLPSETAMKEYRYQSLKIDYEKRRVFLNGQYVHLTLIEYKIMELLSRNAGRVMTYHTIMKQVWGQTAVLDHQVLRVNMANIRRKLESNPAAPEYIRTEIGVGYWMPEE